jgi:DNA-binding CsgD family transcriptional regulator
VSTDGPAETVRLAELTTALSLATDVGLGEPFEHAQRSALLAARLAELAGLPTAEASTAYYLGMLKTVGCAGDDDLGFRVLGEDLGEWMGPIGGAGMMEALGLFIRNVGKDEPAPRRLVRVLGALASAPAVMAASAGHCEVGMALAQRLGLGAAVVRGLGQVFERWDGAGQPHRIKGEALDRPVRVAQVATDAETAHRMFGPERTLEILRRRGGKGYDPRLVDLVCQTGPGFLQLAGGVVGDRRGSGRRAGPTRDADRSAAGQRRPRDGRIRRPQVALHPRATPRRWQRWPPRPVSGPVCPPPIGPRWRGPGTCTTWARRGVPAHLGQGGRAQRIGMGARPHAHLLHRADPGPPAGPGAGGRHRRPGPRAPRRYRLPPSSAAAGRPGGRPPAGRRRRLPGHDRAPRPPSRTVAATGRRAAEQGSGVRPLRPRRCRRRAGRRRPPGGPARAQLSRRPVEREVEVLRVLARGRTNKEIATELQISVKTAGNHVQHIFEKIGVTTRAAATLFAMQNDLLPPS